MRRLTRDDITSSVSGAEITIAQILGTGATVDEWAEAQARIANDEPFMNAGKPLATGRVRQLLDILAELEPAEEDEDRSPTPGKS